MAHTTMVTVRSKFPNSPVSLAQHGNYHCAAGGVLEIPKALWDTLSKSPRCALELVSDEDKMVLSGKAQADTQPLTKAQKNKLARERARAEAEAEKRARAEAEAEADGDDGEDEDDGEDGSGESETEV